jgi:hypothetical protein
VRSRERSTSAAMCVDRRKRCRASKRRMTTSSSVTRKDGGCDARRNRGRRVRFVFVTSCMSNRTRTNVSVGHRSSRVQQKVKRHHTYSHVPAAALSETLQEFSVAEFKGGARSQAVCTHFGKGGDAHGHRLQDRAGMRTRILRVSLTLGLLRK